MTMYLGTYLHYLLHAYTMTMCAKQDPELRLSEAVSAYIRTCPRNATLVRERESHMSARYRVHHHDFKSSLKEPCSFGVIPSCK